MQALNLLRVVELIISGCISGGRKFQGFTMRLMRKWSLWVVCIFLDVGYDHVWPGMTTCDQVWPRVTMYDHVWPCMTTCDQVWPRVTMNDNVWSGMTMKTGNLGMVQWMNSCNILWQKHKSWTRRLCSSVLSPSFCSCKVEFSILEWPEVKNLWTRSICVMSCLLLTAQNFPLHFLNWFSADNYENYFIAIICRILTRLFR